MSPTSPSREQPSKTERRRIDQSEILQRKEILLPYLFLFFALILDNQDPTQQSHIYQIQTNDMTAIGMAKQPKRRKPKNLTDILQEYYRSTPFQTFYKLKPSNIKTSAGGKGTTITLNPYGYFDVQTNPYSSQRQFTPRMNWQMLWRDLGSDKHSVPQVNVNFRFIETLKDLEGMPQELRESTRALLDTNQENSELMLIHITLSQITEENKPEGNKKVARGVQQIPNSIQYYFVVQCNKRSCSSYSEQDLQKLYDELKKKLPFIKPWTIIMQAILP